MVPKTVWTRIGLSVGVAALAAATATGAFGGSGGSRTSAATATPTLAVVVVGGGRVTSAPAGISCPGKCAAAFAAGSRVLLTPTPKSGSRFLRWGGDCTGARACRVRVSGLAAVAAQFVGATTNPAPPPSFCRRARRPTRADANGSRVTFFVPAGAGSVLELLVPASTSSAQAAAAYGAPFEISKATIKPDRSFTAKTSQNGVVNGVRVAKFTLFRHRALPGEVRDRGDSGERSVARRTSCSPTRPTATCTSNDQTRGRRLERSRRTRSPSRPARTLAAADRQPRNVPCPGRRRERAWTSRSRVNVCLRRRRLRTALPSRSRAATIKRVIARSPATTSQSGVVGGANAKFTYFVTGYFQGYDSAGAQTAAGVYREDIVFTDAPNRTCTSNDQPWTAARTG